MRICRSALLIALALVGCGGSSTPSDPFALEGGWTYLGPSDGPHDLEIGDGTMVYTDVAGTWSSHWTIKSYDNDLHRFQMTFDSGSGTYLPVGQSLSGTYDLSGTLLTTQTATGLAAYPPLMSPGSCTRDTDGTPIPECRTYIKKN
jgi:hypothetical protein